MIVLHKGGAHMENEEKTPITSEEEKHEEANEQIHETKKARKPINTAKGGLIWSIWNFLEAALIMVLGILCFVYTAQASQDSDYDKVISVILLVGGIFLIVGGVLKIIVNFLPIVGRNIVDAAVKSAVKSQLSYDLVIGGAIELAIGVALVVSYQMNGGEMTGIVGFIATFLAVFIGVLVIAAGLSLIMFAIGFIVSKLYKIYLPIIEIIFGAALIALGIVVLYFFIGDPSLTKLISLIVLGIVLVLAGIAMAIVTILEINKARLKKAVVQDVKETIEVVDALSKEEK